MDRYACLGYGLLAGSAGALATLYSVAFLGNLGLEFSLDSDARVAWPVAALCNAIWLLLFGLQHSGMARGIWKRWLAQFMPAAAVRSTYVLLSSLLMMLLFCFWQPIGGTLWDLQDPVWVGVIYALYFLGWSIMGWAIFLMGPAEMLGVKQTWFHWARKPLPQDSLVEPGPYRFTRHPVYLGWLIVFWANPIMSWGHLGLAVGLTLYLLLAIGWEERDLLTIHGDAYRNYRKRVPMLVPLITVWPVRSSARTDPAEDRSKC